MIIAPPTLPLPIVAITLDGPSTYLVTITPSFNTQVFYTVDGTDATIYSFAYTAPFNTPTTSSVHAIAVDPSGANSDQYNSDTDILATLYALLAEAKIPTRDGTLTVTSSACVSSKSPYGAVGANTADGRDVSVGGIILPGAALRAERATTGVFGQLSINSNLASNATAAGTYPIERTIVENASAGFHNATSATLALTDGVDYVYSAYIKQGVGTRDASISCGIGANAAGVSLNFNTLVLTDSLAGNGVVVRKSVRSLGGGWFFIQFTFNSPAWGASPRVAYAFLLGGTQTQNYTGDGVSSLIISGYCVVQGDYAVMPLAWDGSEGVSRVAQLNSWSESLSTTAGTVASSVMPYGRSGTVASSSSPRIYSALDTVAGLMFYLAASQNYESRRVDGVGQNQAITAATPAIAGNQFAVAQRWSAAANSIIVNGITVSSGVPTPPFIAGTPIIIGNLAALSQPFDGWVFAPKWDRALTDAELAIWDSHVNIL